MKIVVDVPGLSCHTLFIGGRDEAGAGTGETTMTTLTTTLRNGQTVLAKLYKGQPSVKTFANLKQANAAAAKVPGAWVTARWPFLVVVPATAPVELATGNIWLIPQGGQWSAWTVVSVEGDRVRFSEGDSIEHSKDVATVLKWIADGVMVTGGRKL